jgi:FecR protein
MQYVSRRRGRRLLAGVLGTLLILMLGVSSSPLAAQTSAINQARVTEILDSDQVYIQSNRARLNDLANRGQRVTTGTARAQLNFNTGAVARLSPNSVLTVGQCAQLQRGILLVNGAANGCTASVTAGVRGTTYILEVDDQGQEQIKVLEGEVVVTRQTEALPDDDATATPSTSPDTAADPPDAAIAPTIPPTIPTPDDATASDPSMAQPNDDQVVLTAGQRLATRRGERLGPIQQLTAQDFIDILTGQLIDGFTGELPGIDRIRGAFQQLFPSVPFPLSAPSLPIPRPRIPFF